jgi:hypothetical protein
MKKSVSIARVPPEVRTWRLQNASPERYHYPWSLSFDCSSRKQQKQENWRHNVWLLFPVSGLETFDAQEL